MFGYWLDKNENIVRWVGKPQEWNSAHDQSTVGQSVWNFILGARLKRSYSILFQAVRSSHKTVNLIYRCDAPDTKRLMQMHLKYLPQEGILCCENYLLGEKQKQARLKPTPHQGILYLCNMCARVKLEGESWLTQEESPYMEIHSRSHFENELCPRCAAQMTPNAIQSYQKISHSSRTLTEGQTMLEAAALSLAKCHALLNREVLKEFGEADKKKKK